VRATNWNSSRLCSHPSADADVTLHPGLLNLRRWRQMTMCSYNTPHCTQSRSRRQHFCSKFHYATNISDYTASNSIINRCESGHSLMEILPERNRGKQHGIVVGTIFVSAEVRTRHLPNTNLKRCRYYSLHGATVGQSVHNRSLGNTSLRLHITLWDLTCNTQCERNRRTGLFHRTVWLLKSWRNSRVVLRRLYLSLCGYSTPRNM
jgi:hypothetical protein